MNQKELENLCNIPGVKITAAEDGLDFIEVANDLATATICLMGAHVVSYTPAGEKPVLWMSKKSLYQPHKALRGGIPVCWPWFGPSKVDGRPAHGFARISDWEIESVCEITGGATQIVLSLDSEEAAFPMAEFPFRLELTITVGSELELALTMCSNAEEPEEIGAALHSYFAVSDIEKIKVRGLDGVLYTNKAKNAEQVEGNVQHGDLTFHGEVDSVFAPTSGAIEIVDPAWNRTIVVEKSGSLSSVVWNPWIDKAKAMPDYGDEEYHEMVCVEAANALEDTRLLLPGLRHTISQKISVRHE